VVSDYRLRWTSTQEWHDIYQPENIDGLQKFFDKYMLGIDNGWEKTPKIRCSMLGYNRPSVINRPASEYPPADFTYETLFLDANTGKLSDRQPSDEGIVEYQADLRSDDGCKFVYTVEKYTELFGISKLKVWMSTDDHNDMVSCENTIHQTFLSPISDD
jgi:predicted acyl esterase